MWIYVCGAPHAHACMQKARAYRFARIGLPARLAVDWSAMQLAMIIRGGIKWMGLDAVIRSCITS